LSAAADWQRADCKAFESMMLFMDLNYLVVAVWAGL